MDCLEEASRKETLTVKRNADNELETEVNGVNNNYIVSPQFYLQLTNKDNPGSSDGARHNKKHENKEFSERNLNQAGKRWVTIGEKIGAFIVKLKFATVSLWVELPREFRATWQRKSTQSNSERPSRNPRELRKKPKICNHKLTAGEQQQE